MALFLCLALKILRALFLWLMVFLCKRKSSLFVNRAGFSQNILFWFCFPSEHAAYVHKQLDDAELALKVMADCEHVKLVPWVLSPDRQRTCMLSGKRTHSKNACILQDTKALEKKLVMAGFMECKTAVSPSGDAMVILFPGIVKKFSALSFASEKLYL